MQLNRTTMFFTFALSALSYALTSQAVAQEAGEIEMDREQLRKEMRSFLLEEPEIIVKALQKLELKRQQELQMAVKRVIQDRQQELYNDGYSYIGGNPEGDVTLVEFLDYNCGFCRRAHPIVQELIQTDGNIRYIVKEFPVLGHGSIFAAAAALAILADEEQAKHYPAFTDAMLRYNGAIEHDSVEEIAEELGIDDDWLESAAAQPSVKENVQKNLKLAQELGIDGTPSFVLGDNVIAGYRTLEELRALIAEERKQAGTTQK